MNFRAIQSFEKLVMEDFEILCFPFSRFSLDYSVPIELAAFTVDLHVSIIKPKSRFRTPNLKVTNQVYISVATQIFLKFQSAKSKSI
jgi:hypothetical protein